MPFNGSGTFVRNYSWVNDATNSIPITASRMDADSNDFASGLSNCVTRDGQGLFTSTINANNQTLTNLNPGSVSVPSIGFQTSTNTGIYLPNPGNLGIAIGGLQRVNISTGNFTLNTPNLVFGGTSQLIVGDFSNSTISLRTMFQSGTTNGSTAMQAIPNGASTNASYTVFNQSNLASAWSAASMGVNNTFSYFGSYAGNGGTLQPLVFQVGTEYARIATTGQFLFNTTSLSGLYNAQIEVNFGTLGSTSGNVAPMANFFYSSTNNDQLQIIGLRGVAGSSWYDAATRIERIVDVTPQAYISFGDGGGNTSTAYQGLTFGIYNGTAQQEAMRLTNVGNLLIGQTFDNGAGWPIQVSGANAGSTVTGVIQNSGTTNNSSASWESYAYGVAAQVSAVTNGTSGTGAAFYTSGGSGAINTEFGTTTNGYVSFLQNNLERARFAATSGNFLVGTTTDLSPRVQAAPAAGAGNPTSTGAQYFSFMAGGSGVYGGGFALNDIGAGVWGIYSGGGALYFGSASNLTTGLTNQLSLSSTGALTVPNQISFIAYRNATQNSGTNIIFDTVQQQNGSGYSATTGVFTAPVAGTYLFTFQGEISNTSGGTISYYLTLTPSSGTLVPQSALTPTPTSGTNVTSGGAVILNLAANATVKIVPNVIGATSVWGGGGQTYFTGELLH